MIKRKESIIFYKADSFSSQMMSLMMMSLSHDNINLFIGICVEPEHTMYVMEYAAKGSLQDVLLNENIPLGDEFEYSFIHDIVRGMIYLQSSSIGSHGHLTSKNCLITSRFVLKITDYGLGKFRKLAKVHEGYAQNPQDLLWTAPEFLGKSANVWPLYGTKAGDVYSFSIIMQEIITRMPPFGDQSYISPGTIVEKVRRRSSIPFRPKVALEGKEVYVNIMRVCWNDKPSERPTFPRIHAMLHKANDRQHKALFDNIMSLLELNNAQLQQRITKKSEELIQEKEMAVRVLNLILPRSIADLIRNQMDVEPELYEEVSVLFSDVANFQQIVFHSSPYQIISFLNDLMTSFDEIASKFDVFKVQSTGDTYMVASGVPRREDFHAELIATLALNLLHHAALFNMPEQLNRQLQLRIGINSGPVVGCILGSTRLTYNIFGDTVNVASRMMTSCLALRIHLSTKTAQLLCQSQQQYELEIRGKRTVKGVGSMTTYWLLGKEGFNSSLPNLALALPETAYEIK